MLVKGSFEDYLYIIIGLVWVAFSIYKGAQKKKSLAKTPQQSEEGEVQKKKKSFFDEFLSEIIKDDEPVPNESIEVEEKFREPVIVEQDKVFSYDDIVEESNVIVESNVYEVKPTTDLNFQQELKSHLKSKKEQPRFDLRKAIIYSEILNRRYF
jgi:hypothetical protein